MKIYDTMTKFSLFLSCLCHFAQLLEKTVKWISFKIGRLWLLFTAVRANCNIGGWCLQKNVYISTASHF